MSTTESSCGAVGGVIQHLGQLQRPAERRVHVSVSRGWMSYQAKFRVAVIYLAFCILYFLLYFITFYIFCISSKNVNTKSDHINRPSWPPYLLITSLTLVKRATTHYSKLKEKTPRMFSLDDQCSSLVAPECNNVSVCVCACVFMLEPINTAALCTICTVSAKIYTYFEFHLSLFRQ